MNQGVADELTDYLATVDRLSETMDALIDSMRALATSNAAERLAERLAVIAMRLRQGRLEACLGIAMEPADYDRLQRRHRRLEALFA